MKVYMRTKQFSVLPIAIPLFVMGALVLIVGIVLPLGNKPEPLADPQVLSALINGRPIAQPDAPVNPAEFHGETMIPPNLTPEKNLKKVLGAFTGTKHIDVDLANQRVYAYEGDRQVLSFIVSTGKWGRTPTGTFTIWTKVRSQTMSGGDKAAGTYYYLPNIEYVMFFAGGDVDRSRGFSFHSTYWHNNFGHPMSHGCVNMRTADAKMLYEWATPTVKDEAAWSTLASAENPGTLVNIYGEPPIE